MASKHLPQNPWEETFESLFGSLKDRWDISEENIKTLQDISTLSSAGWKKFKGKGKVSFVCDGCSNKWTSVMGTVIFHYRLNRKSFTSSSGGGEVKFWCRFGQQCKKCKRGGFETPSWEAAGIEETLGYLLQKVQEKFYNGPKKDASANQLDGKRTAPHLKELCEACREGVCSYSREDTSRAFEENPVDYTTSYLGNISLSD